MTKKIELIMDFLEAIRTDGKHVRLDQNEALVLRSLLGKAPGMLSAESLAWSALSDSTKTGAVAVYVMRLRRKLGRQAIITVNGRGYRMAA